MDKQISVIIVDDDEAILDSLKSILALQGYHCETAANGKAALELINKLSFDIMITDLKMPVMTGLELTKKVKELKPDMKVIVMTGFLGAFSHDEILEIGASGLLEKPFILDELLGQIKHTKVDRN